MPPPVLFLDFDGVLNNDNFLRFQKNHIPQREQRLFDPENLRALEQLVEALSIDTCIVTSSWRQERTVIQLQEILLREGLACSHAIRGVTAILGGSLEARSAEISDWVMRHRPERYIVLDDFDLAELGSGFYRVRASTGLTRELADKIVADFRTG